MREKPAPRSRPWMKTSCKHRRQLRRAEAPAAGAADTRLSTAERLPLGKQSVAVTVDVQAPATMNLTKQATFKLIVRNTGVGDAYNVRVDDELPDGLTFISSQPEMKLSGEGHHLSWLLNLLPGGSDRVITLKVQPTKTGPFDHVATVQFETGCKSRTTVLAAPAQGRHHRQPQCWQGAQGAAGRV